MRSFGDVGKVDSYVAPPKPKAAAPSLVSKLPDLDKPITKKKSTTQPKRGKISVRRVRMSGADVVPVADVARPDSENESS